MVWWPAKQTADDEAGHYDLSCQIQCFFWCEVIYQFKFIHGCCLGGGGGWVERMNESLKRQSTHILLHSPMAVHPKQPNEPFRSGWLVPIMCWSTILWMAHCWHGTFMNCHLHSGEAYKYTILWSALALEPMQWVNSSAVQHVLEFDCALDELNGYKQSCQT